MRVVALRPRRCERARQWISLDTDNELSPFERAMLASHLLRCADCSAFRLDVGALTHELRAAPLEKMSHHVTLPSRRRVSMRSLQLAGSAAAVFAIALGGTVGAISTDSVRRLQSNRPAYIESPQYEINHLMKPVPATPRPNTGPGRAV